ncbi:hypothetical protein RUM43_002231 [Polyplax serrata]|uniref:Uncharacterized protein n=1 Tax=Polyplax serrata TaxID=468196 RepID=A0AAN8S5U9_POLSC
MKIARCKSIDSRAQVVDPRVVEHLHSFLSDEIELLSNLSYIRASQFPVIKYEQIGFWKDQLVWNRYKTLKVDIRMQNTFLKLFPRGYAKKNDSPFENPKKKPLCHPGRHS